MKTLTCRDAGVDCDFVARGSTDDDVLKKAAEHGKKVHGMKDTDFTKDKVVAFKRLIHEAGSTQSPNPRT